jgi:hypothetical protein
MLLESLQVSLSTLKQQWYKRSVELYIASVLQRLIELGLPQYCSVNVVRDGFPFIRLHGYREHFRGHST